MQGNSGPRRQCCQAESAISRALGKRPCEWAGCQATEERAAGAPGCCGSRQQLDRPARDTCHQCTGACAGLLALLVTHLDQLRSQAGGCWRPMPELSACQQEAMCTSQAQLCLPAVLSLPQILCVCRRTMAGTCQKLCSTCTRTARRLAMQPARRLLLLCWSATRRYALPWGAAHELCTGCCAAMRHLMHSRSCSLVRTLQLAEAPAHAQCSQACRHRLGPNTCLHSMCTLCVLLAGLHCPEWLKRQGRLVSQLTPGCTGGGELLPGAPQGRRHPVHTAAGPPSTHLRGGVLW